jgi:anti-sigma regulatory factor (Ser/Thr protein kinase)
MTSATRDLNCHTGAPAVARRWTAACLREHLGDQPPAAELIDDATLCVSELVTNAVSAGCSYLRVELVIGEDGVRVGVVDDAPGRPAARTAGATDLSGRGLSLVEAVSRRWGVDVVERGKLVWAELATS